MSETMNDKTALETIAELRAVYGDNDPVREALDYIAARLAQQPKTPITREWCENMAKLELEHDAVFDVGTPSPSCFTCGAAWKSWEGCTRHLNLPGIFACAECARKIRNYAQPAAAVAVAWLCEYENDGWTSTSVALDADIARGEELSGAKVTPLYAQALAQRAVPEPSAEHWRKAINEKVASVGLSCLYESELDWIEKRARELAKGAK